MPDFINVLETLQDPSRCDLLHVYAITNFNAKKHALISNLAVNHLKIFPVATLKGLVLEDQTITAPISFDKEDEEFSLKQNRSIRFDTNDDADELLKNQDVCLCFSINKKGTKKHSVPLYFLVSCDRASNEVFKNDFVPSDDVKNMPSPQKYFSLKLQNLETLLKTPLTQIDISAIPYLPSISSIDGISYEVPINSVYQTLTVYGNLYNERTGAFLEDVPIPLTVRENPENVGKFSGKGPVSFLPILCDISSPSTPGQLHIRNFDLRYQLPFDAIKEAWQAETPFHLLNPEMDEHSDPKKTIYECVFSNDTSGIGQSLLKLFKELFIYSGLYRNNFSIGNDKKGDPKFQNFFNTTFANKTAFEFSQEILERWLLENPGVEQRVGDLNINHLKGEKFQALCLACSSFLVSPFSGNAGESKEHRNFLWYYIELNDVKSPSKKKVKRTTNDNEPFQLSGLAQQIKDCFNNQGVFIYENFDNLQIECRIFSNFFKGETVQGADKKSTKVLKSKVKSLSHAEINVSELEKQAVPPLPDAITTINENGDPALKEPVSNKLKYLCNLVVYEHDIEKLLSLGTFKRTETVEVPFSFEKTVTQRGKSLIVPPTPDYTLDDLKSVLPVSVADKISLKDINGNYTIDFLKYYESGNEPAFDEKKGKLKITQSAPQTSYTYRDCSDQYDAPQKKVMFGTIETGPARHGANIPGNKDYCRVWFDMPASNNAIIFGFAGFLPGLINKVGNGLGGKGDMFKGAEKLLPFPHKGSEAFEPRDILSTTYYGTYRFDAELTIKTNCINNFASLDSFGLRHLLNRDASDWKESVVVTFELEKEIKNAGWSIIGINHDEHVGFFNSAKKLVIGYSYFSHDERGDGILKNDRIVKKEKGDELKKGDKGEPELTFFKLFTTEEGDLNFNFQKNHPAVVRTEHRY